MLIEQKSRIVRPKWLHTLRKVVLIYFMSLPVAGGAMIWMGGKSSALARLIMNIDGAVRILEVACAALFIPAISLMVLETYFVLFGKTENG